MGSVWLTNRRTMRIVAVLFLILIFAAAIIGAMLLRRGTEIDVNVSAAATATASAAKPAVASPPPTAAPTQTPVVAAAPTAPPTPPTPPTPVVVTPTPAPAPAAAPTGPPAQAPASGAIATAVVISTLPAQPTPEAKPQAPAPAPPALPTPQPAPKPPAAAPAGAPSPAAAAKPAPVGPPATVAVDASQETMLRCVDNRVTVTVRPNTLPAGFSLTCRPVAPNSVPPPPGQVVGNLVFQLESDGRAELPAEVNLGVSYRDQNVEEAAERQLVIASLEDGQWRPAPRLATDPPNDFISATVTRLAVYAVYRQG